jgi:riboflavin synthase
MFTGIIKEIGIVNEISKNKNNIIFGISSKKVIKELEIGSSISVDGVCLTVTKITNTMFFVEAVEETLKRTTLIDLSNGSKVNLETSIKPSEGLGGHIVQGHIDEIGKISNIERQEGGWLYSINVPENIREFIVEKGSIAIDGISLTVAKLKEDAIIISIIPFTIKNTTIGEKIVGDKVNIEVDIISKYVKNFLEKKEDKGKITLDWLRKTGFI